MDAIESAGYEADRKAADDDRIVILHQWTDGMLLTMMFDSEMPGFTTQPIIRGKLPRITGKDAATTATGYVFRLAERSPNGVLFFKGERYEFTDIYDYVSWTDETAIREKYDEVREKAARE